MNFINRITYLFICGLFLLNSCMTSKRVVFVKDMEQDIAQPIREMPVLLIQKGDRLNIVVSSKNPELVLPFNNISGNYSVGDKGEITNLPNASMVGQSLLVDQQGQITFPILGNLKIEGMSLEEVKNFIQDQLIVKKIVNDPIVRAEILNMKITVTGAVKSDMVINVPDGRMTLLEAITKAGGLTPNALPNRVTVIREENGARVRMINNIESKNIFDSPTYYLRQNDIVYVEARSAENTPKEERSWRVTGAILGSVTLILSVISLVK